MAYVNRVNETVERLKKTAAKASREDAAKLRDMAQQIETAWEKYYSVKVVPEWTPEAKATVDQLLDAADKLLYDLCLCCICGKPIKDGDEGVSYRKFQGRDSPEDEHAHKWCHNIKYPERRVPFRG